MASSSPFVTHYIQPTFTLARLTKEDEIYSLIVTLVKKVAPLVENPLLLDLLIYVANLVENMIKKGDKIDRNEMIIKIYKDVFPTITEEQLHIINIHIQSLHDNKLIKKIPLYKKVWYYGSQFFNRYVLN